MIEIRSGNTATDVLKYLGEDPASFTLSRTGSADTVFGEDEPIYPNVENGGLLFCTSIAGAGE